MSDPSQTLEAAVSELNGQTAFAAALSAEAGRTITQQHVHGWLTRGRRILPAEYVLAAERAMAATSKPFKRTDFRPDIYPPAEVAA